MAVSEVDAVIVWAGFGGLYMLHRLRGLGFSAVVLEAGGGVGGTWYWNRYPGARCDVESIQYSYQFSEELQQDWEWSERYAAQPEILRYAEHVAERFDLYRDIRFDTRVKSARFDEAGRRWAVETDTGDRLAATWCVMATGCLSASNIPAFEGRDSFSGATYHTGHWPHEDVDFSVLRVGVIGTGSSAIQSIPIIAEQAAQLTVFQRTPNYAIPAHNAPWDPEVLRQAKAGYPEMRARAKRTPNGIAFRLNPQSALEATPEERRREYEARWREGGLTFLGAYGDLILNPEANATAAEFVREKIRAIVTDPEMAAALSPSNIIGCKRLCVDTGYYQTFNRPNVALVDINKAPIERITADGVRAGGVDHAFDALVFATGFDAMTGALLKIDIRGAGGRPLRYKWDGGPRTYLGLATAGFPNLFMITGPGSPSVLTNMLPSIEQHVDWIADCLAHMRANGIARVEAEAAAEDDWVAHVNEVAGFSLRSTCSSWYVGANVPGKPRVFMPYIGGFPAYVDRCDAVAANGYQGFALSA